MTLTIKNADNALLEAIETIIKLSSNSYEIIKSPEDIYADEVRKIIKQVENGEMKTRTMEESKAFLDIETEKIKAKYASH